MADLVSGSILVFSSRSHLRQSHQSGSGDGGSGGSFSSGLSGVLGDAVGSALLGALAAGRL